MNAREDLGPRLLHYLPDILGRAFLVMERCPGSPLLAAPHLVIGRLLVETQLRLQALDPDPLLRALEREVSLARARS